MNTKTHMNKKTYKPGDSFFLRDGCKRTIIVDSNPQYVDINGTRVEIPDVGSRFSCIDERGVVKLAWRDSISNVMAIYEGIMAGTSKDIDK